MLVPMLRWSAIGFWIRLRHHVGGVECAGAGNVIEMYEDYRADIF